MSEYLDPGALNDPPEPPEPLTTTVVESERRCVECGELLADGTRANVRRCQYCAVAKHLGEM